MLSGALLTVFHVSDLPHLHKLVRAEGVDLVSHVVHLFCHSQALVDGLSECHIQSVNLTLLLLHSLLVVSNCDLTELVLLVKIDKQLVLTLDDCLVLLVVVHGPLENLPILNLVVFALLV